MTDETTGYEPMLPVNIDHVVELLEQLYDKYDVEKEDYEKRHDETRKMIRGLYRRFKDQLCWVCKRRKCIDESTRWCSVCSDVAPVELCGNCRHAPAILGNKDKVCGQCHDKGYVRDRRGGYRKLGDFADT